MGVYLFRHRKGGWVKLGSYVCRGGCKRPRDNPYYRIARRGFWNISHPRDIQNDLGVDAFALVAWFPNIGRKEEGTLHRAFPDGAVGEFHPARAECDILTAAASIGGVPSEVTWEDREAALRWAFVDESSCDVADEDDTPLNHPVPHVFAVPCAPRARSGNPPQGKGRGKGGGRGRGTGGVSEVNAPSRGRGRGGRGEGGRGVRTNAGRNEVKKRGSRPRRGGYVATSADV
jgi:hypothetical protein